MTRSLHPNYCPQKAPQHTFFNVVQINACIIYFNVNALKQKIISLKNAYYKGAFNSFIMHEVQCTATQSILTFNFFQEIDFTF